MVERFEKFSLSIAEISRCWHKLAAEEMKVYGLKGAHALYLTTLYRYPQGITVPELCELCLKDKSDASRMLAILEKKELVRKEGGYGGTVQLTEAGLQAARQVRSRVCRAVEEAGKDLSAEEREIFYKALGSITENLQRLTCEGIPQ
ncbi:MarR family winged helix-turn-helix transcriptional regulator [uncultured Subdoligranulum sp.]|jgi:DNA-binding MarR family transcriptional regulator|uniref:MarR family winged helix-turn-helix transcriptional regulator n=1 Tax=uncultured Subdoligranulum sp. TaxID=512298 RepID=UPI0025EB02EC|nr:MarR family transcriptional regulator [uncultured Subdoligranulum sp.]